MGVAWHPLTQEFLALMEQPHPCPCISHRMAWPAHQQRSEGPNPPSVPSRRVTWAPAVAVELSTPPTWGAWEQKVTFQLWPLLVTTRLNSGLRFILRKLSARQLPLLTPNWDEMLFCCVCLQGWMEAGGVSHRQRATLNNCICELIRSSTFKIKPTAPLQKKPLHWVC